MINKIKNFNENIMKKTHQMQMPVYARLLDVQSELGELAKEYLKSTKYGTRGFVVSENFKLEFGDVLYSILTLANELDIDAEKTLDAVLEKYKKRLDDKEDMGSGN